jgi:hypothetical protein
LQVAQLEFKDGSSVNGISPFTPLQSGNSTQFFYASVGFSTKALISLSSFYNKVF